MSENVSFYLIKAEYLEKVPAGVQKFVKEYFKRVDIFGIPHFVVLEVEFESPWEEMAGDDYKEGLSQDELNGLGILAWIDNHPEFMFVYFL